MALQPNAVVNSIFRLPAHDSYVKYPDPLYGACLNPKFLTPEHGVYATAYPNATLAMTV